MQLSAAEFNAKHKVGDQLLYFPHGDELPILTVRVAGEAFLGQKMKPSVCVIGENGEGIVPLMLLSSCSQKQLDKIVMILDSNL